MGNERRRAKTQLTPATKEELDAFKREHGLKNLDEDPPGTDTLTLGELVDEALESRRRKASAKR